MLNRLNVSSHFFWLLILPLCGACGGSSQTQAQSLGPFTAQVNQFVSDAAAHGRSVDITHLVVQQAALTSDSSTVVVGGVSETTTTADVGLCEFNASGPTVTISNDAAQNYGPESLEALIYHELGHCLLTLEHNEDLNSDGTPASMMYPTGVDGLTYMNNRAAYLNELFSEQEGSAFQGGE
jgi:hypothetical protein